MSKKLPLLFLSSLAVLSLGSCTQKHVHSYDLENPVWEWEQFSSASVSFTCSGCAESEEGHTHTVEADITLKSSEASTCEKAGNKVYEASASFEDHTFTDTKTQPLPASGHKEDDSVWKFDANKHWHDCLYCKDAKHFQEAEHTLTDWTETVASTYHEEGTKERHCTVCAYTETASVAKLRYTYDQVKACAEAFLKYEEGSAYLGRSLESLLDSIENMDEEEKTAHLEEVNAWKEAATKAKTSYENYYSILVDTEGMNTYTKTKTTIEASEKYGDVLKVNGDETLVEGECWDYGSDRKEDVLKEGISAIRFMIYAPQPMNVSFINHDCNTWYDASTGQIVHAKKETTMAAGEWKEFTIPTSAIEEMDTFHIALYLSPSPYIGYGIPTVSDNTEKGSAYISEIIGVKEAYYEPLAASLDASIASFGEKTLTMWDGAELKKIRSDYDALPSAAKALVKNAETLATLEATYAASWTCYNYSWVQGQVNKSTTFTSTIGVDETYGVYTEFLTASDAWIVHWTPDSDTAITKDAKMAVYNPTDSNANGYYVDNGWQNAANLTFAPGWSVIDLPAAIFKNSVANGASVGIQIKSITDGGWKFSAIYSE